MTIHALNKVDAQAIADQHEDELTAAYRTVLEAAGRKAAARFKVLAPFATTAAGDEPSQPNWSPPNIDELVDLDLIAQQTVTATRSLNVKVLAQIMDAYGNVTSQVTEAELGEPAFDIKNPASIALLDSWDARAGDVAKDIRDDLQKIIAEAYTQGFSVSKTASTIRATTEQFSAAQSRALARTSLNGIANGGSFMAAKEVGVAYKTWVATEDDRTRETHAEADGQTVPIGEQFDVGGESCDYPGDPSLSDEESFNCRCVLTYSDSLTAGLQDDEVGATIGGEMADPQITIPLNITIGQASTNQIQAVTDELTHPMTLAQIARLQTQLADDADLWAIDDLPFAATGATDLPLSDRNMGWDAGAARKTLQPADFPKAHFWRDPNGPADQITSYKFPFAQRIDGKLTAVWKGVTAGAQRLSSAKGVDTSAIQAKMAAYYRKAAKQYKDPTIKAPFATEDQFAMQPHVFMDDGDGMCSVCGMSAGAAIHTGLMAAIGSPTWRAVLCVEGEPTEDGRLLAPGSITWRELPLSLMCQTETQPGHDGAEVCGRIDRIWRDGSNIMGEGIFDAGEFGLEAARLVTDQVLRGVSVDLAVLEYEIQAAPDSDDEAMDIADGLAVPDDTDELFVVTDGVIGAATICAFQAIGNATIESVTSSSGPLLLRATRAFTLTVDAITASAAGMVPAKPPAEWFSDPHLDGPTPITVTDDGRIYGHAALWSTCHIGHPSGCVTPPRSPSGYRYFHLGEAVTETGVVDVGTVTMGTGHAPLRMGSTEALEHYDDTGTSAAPVRAGEDRFGIWVAGAINPGLSSDRVAVLRGSKLSGDWRSINGQLELVGLLAVNVPGFPVPRPTARVASVADDMERVALVAAGVPADREPSPHRVKILAARARGGIEGLAELARS